METEKGNSESAKLTPSPMPDVGDMIFFFIMQLVLFWRPNILFGDGSTGWHLVTGDYVLKHGHPPTTDLMSYTFPDRAWVAYEWLFDAFIAGLAKIGGLNLVAVAIGAIIGFLFIRLYDRMRQERCFFAFSAFITFVGILVAAMHFLARPHIIAWIGIYLFSAFLDDFDSGRIKARTLILSLAGFMIIWVNSHPIFLLGLALTGLYMVVSACRAVFASLPEARKDAFTKTKVFALTLAACLAASLVNFYGIGLYQYIFTYLKGSVLLEATDEFLSPIFHGGLHPTCLEILFAILALGLFLRPRGIPAAQMGACLSFAHLALSAVRNMPGFVIVSLPAIGRLFSRQQAVGEPVSGNKMKKAWLDFDDQERLCKMHILPIVFTLFLCVVAIMGGNLMGSPFLSCGFDPEDKPTATLDYVKTNKLPYDKGFNYDNWGGYIRWKLGERVFIDDRADFYGEAHYRDYVSVNMVNPGWEEVLKKHDIQWIVFPAKSRLVAALAKSSDWRLAASDKASKLFVRVSAASFAPRRGTVLATVPEPVCTNQTRSNRKSN